MKTKKTNKKSQKQIENILKLILTLILTITITATLIKAAPPEPQTIEGKIYNDGGTGAENGIPIIINNTNTTQIFYTEVNAPPVPPLYGSYSASINGSTGDIVTVTAYNNTHYGQTQALLNKKTTTVDVTMNITRNSEANITITNPENNTNYNISQIFNLTTNMTVLGSDGTNCNVTIDITDNTIISLNTGTNITNQLGNINIGQYSTTNFELMANNSGSVNITVIALCSPDGIKFENLNTYTIYNINVEDTTPPNIQLINPENNTENKSTNEIDFTFNVTDSTNIQNCTLIINGQPNKTKTPITKDTTQTIAQNLTNGQYNWSIQCTDQYLNTGNSTTRNLTISVYFPKITRMTIDQNIMLNAGTTKKINCNITIEDENGATDITGSNITFYHYTSNPQSIDNNNNHYTNTTCIETNSLNNQKNYTCTINIQYYANNGTWYCNASSTDQQELTNTNSTNTIIQPLYALNTSNNIIDYGQVQAGQTSNEIELNITNLGNMPINISTKGYGSQDPVIGNNLAMMCNNGNNITITNQRYDTVQSTPFNAKKTLQSINQDVQETINKQTIPSLQQIQQSYWQIQIPGSPITQCNGTIVLTATSP